MEKSLEEIGAMLGHLSNRLAEVTRGCPDPELEFLCRKHAVALTNINLNLQTLAACVQTKTPVTGIRLNKVEVNP